MKVLLLVAFLGVLALADARSADLKKLMQLLQKKQTLAPCDEDQLDALWDDVVQCAEDNGVTFPAYWSEDDKKRGLNKRGDSSEELTAEEEVQELICYLDAEDPPISVSDTQVTDILSCVSGAAETNHNCDAELPASVSLPTDAECAVLISEEDKRSTKDEKIELAARILLKLLDK